MRPLRPLSFLGVGLALFVVASLGWTWLTIFAARHALTPVERLATGLAAANLALALLLAIRLGYGTRQLARLETSHVAKATERRYQSLVQNSSDAITVLDARGHVTYASSSAGTLLYVSPAELHGRPLLERAIAEDVPLLERLLAEVQARPGGRAAATWRVWRPDGTRAVLETLARNLLDDGCVQGIVLNTRDVSERRALERQIEHQAFHDALTALPNRALLRDRVDHALLRAARHGRRVCVLFVDLDHFKSVNDSLGHAVGDRVLLQAAERLRACLRVEDTAARLGGDEFAALAEDLESDEQARSVADRIASAFQDPFEVDGHQLLVAASIGLAMAEAGDTADALLRKADTAMYAAKGSGGGRYECYQAGMQAAATAQLELRGELHQAVERNQLRLVYQPVFHLGEGDVRWAEALIRWIHPKRGEVQPGDFVELAEQTGLIVPMGQWVLREACRQARRWQRSVPGADDIGVTVNLSVRQFLHPTLVEDVERVLSDSGLSAEHLMLEITESSLMESGELVLEVLGRLRDLGVRVAVDDFGTGYSSLAYLQRLPIHVLKLPRTFVEEIASAEDEPTLARTILSLAGNLSLMTIAEGIEHEHQAACLRRLGCELGQGFWYGYPMRYDEFVEHLLPRTKRATNPVRDLG